LQSIIDKCRICGTEGETIEHIISSCTVLAQSEYKKRHDIFAKIIHMNLAVKFNLLKDTQPHYIYKPESCLENDTRVCTVTAVEISDREDLNTRNLISVNRIFIKDYKVSVSI
jgi:hypothetical protein